MKSGGSVVDIRRGLGFQTRSAIDRADPWKRTGHTSQRGATKWCVSLLLAASSFAAHHARAQPVSTCVSSTDCDQDGINNFVDVCPAVNGGPAQPAASGFVSIDCYRPLLPALANCIPVAARPFDEQVPNDAFDPDGASTHRKGFTFVGVYDQASGGPAAQNPYVDQASPAQVGADTDEFPTNALFACFGSVEIGTDGSPLTPGPVVYGFRIASFYARSINIAALEAERSLGMGSAFNDALGLIEAVRSPNEEIPDYPVPLDQGVRYGIVGTAGTWDDASGWSRFPDTLTTPFAGDLPQVVNDFEFPGCVDSALPPATKGPFGYDAMVPNDLPQAAPQYFAKFFPDEYLVRGVLLLAGMTGCASHLATPAYVYLSHDTIALPGFPAVRILGLDLFPGIPSSTIDLWWVDEPQVWTRAVEQYAAGFPLRRTHSPTRLELRRPRPAWGPWLGVASLSPSLATAFAGSSEIAEITPPAWTVIRGMAFSALQSTQLDGRPLIDFSQVDGNGGRTVTATLVATEVTNQVYNYADDTWTVYYTYTDGDARQVNSSVLPGGPSPDELHFSFASPNSAIQLSVNFWKDQFNPAGDYWESNAAGSCGTLSQPKRFPDAVAPNPTMTVPEEWCPKPFPDAVARVMEMPSERANLCGGYFANVPNSHWPLLAPRIPFTSLFGHLNGDPQVSDSVPSAAFPSGDLVRSGLVGAVTDAILLHEGADMNFKQKRDFVERDSQRIFGKFDEFVCFGRSVFGVGDTIISCDDPVLRLCGEDAKSGCNPTEVAARVLASNLDEACSCHEHDCGPLPSFVCTGIVCAANSITVCPVSTAAAVANFWLDEAKNYGPQAIKCLALTPPGNIDCGGFSIHKEKVPDFALEHEMEYNIAYGAKDIGLGVQHDCDDSLIDVAAECVFDQKDIRLECNSPSGVCFDDRYRKNNFVFGDDERQVVSVGINKNGRAFTTVPACGVAPLGPAIYPQVVGPGLFQAPEGVWGRMAMTVGENLTCGDADPVTVLSPDVLAERPGETDPDHPFRRDMLGDLIIDCGHTPFRPEIHPPVSMYLHLGGPGRYSLFGWQRKKQGAHEDQSGPITIDLWPAKPKPSASAQLGINVIYGDIGGALGPGWRCAPYPYEGVPDRYRCILYADGRFANGGAADDSARCDRHPRFLPSCQDGVAGGLVEVGWQ